MANIYRVQGDTLTTLADVVRSITGTTGSLTTAQMQDRLETAKTNMDDINTLIHEMTGSDGELSLEEMKTQIEVANAEIEAQAAIIEEISEILDGKAAGSGGESEVVGVELTVTSSTNQYIYFVIGTAVENGVATPFDEYVYDLPPYTKIIQKDTLTVVNCEEPIGVVSDGVDIIQARGAGWISMIVRGNENGTASVDFYD